MTNQAILAFKHITKRFPGVIALDDVSFDLRQGEVLSLCGENGAGKSTLIKTIAGIWAHGSYQGELCLDGKAVAFTGIPDSEAVGIAVIYQELALIQEMTIAENIFLGNLPKKRGGLIDWNQVYSDAHQLLDKYKLKLDPAAKIKDLGVGEQQLVEIIKALAKKSRILLLDEPTAALTESEVEILHNIIKDLRSHGVSCIYISHKLDEVFKISDRITVIRDGKSIKTLALADTDKNEVISLMVGREIKDLFPKVDAPLGDVLMKVQNLTVTERGRRKPMLENINFELRAGEVLGLGGLMGAGRTELLMHIFAGEGERASGTVEMLGEATLGKPHESIRKGLVLVSEDRKRYGLHLSMSIGYNLSLSSIENFTKSGLIDDNVEFKKNETYFKSLKIKAPGQDEIIGNLSGGNQQKVVLGKALMTKPKIVLLDEPTRGIDVGAKLEVYELINKLTAEGKGVILVSSELPELMGMSDNIIILSEGKIGGAFTRATANQENILKAAMAT